MAYVYRHIRHDKNEPFYIGIGKSSDENYYRATTKCNRNKMWKNIVNKTSYDVEIIFEHHDYEFIKKKEIEFINLYGRRQFKNGPLVNMTRGGDGVVGKLITEEYRLAASLAKRGEKHPMFGKKLKDETKRKISAGNKGKVRSEEYKSRLSNSLKGRAAPNKGKKMTECQYLKLLKISESRKILTVKYDLNGEVLSFYDSAIDAARDNGLQQGNITNAVNNQIMYGGFLWRYAIDGNAPIVKPYKLRINPVVQKSLDGVFIAEFESCMAAAKITGYQKSSILRTASGKYKQAYGFKWEFKK